MIKLHQFAPMFGLPNASPFCMKVENYLRMAGLPYQTVAMSDPRKGPKGKLPFIEDGGKVIADSGFILEHLKATYGDPLDEKLSPSERAVAQAFRRLMEENLYFVALHSRWIDDAGWEIVRPAFLSQIPALARTMVGSMIRKQVRENLHAQGVGRHSPHEIYQIGKADLSALSAFLEEKLYFMGSEPTSLDATAYAFLAQILMVPLASPLKTHAELLPNLSAYCRRMKERYYGGARAEA